MLCGADREACGVSQQRLLRNLDPIKSSESKHLTNREVHVDVTAFLLQTLSAQCKVILDEEPFPRIPAESQTLQCHPSWQDEEGPRAVANIAQANFRDLHIQVTEQEPELLNFKQCRFNAKSTIISLYLVLTVAHCFSRTPRDLLSSTKIQDESRRDTPQPDALRWERLLHTRSKCL
jgi:hypothetical protein